MKTLSRCMRTFGKVVGRGKNNHFEFANGLEMVFDEKTIFSVEYKGRRAVINRPEDTVTIAAIKLWMEGAEIFRLDDLPHSFADASEFDVYVSDLDFGILSAADFGMQDRLQASGSIVGGYFKTRAYYFDGERVAIYFAPTQSFGQSICWRTPKDRRNVLNYVLDYTEEEFPVKTFDDCPIVAMEGK